MKKKKKTKIWDTSFVVKTWPKSDSTKPKQLLLAGANVMQSSKISCHQLAREVW